MKRTKTKLVSSIVTLLICFAMLVGSTFAWFTDSASTGVNKIQAGNLDIEVSYKTKDESGNTVWETIQDSDSLFSSDLWEPGHTEFVTLKVENRGTLALKYKMIVSPISESKGISVETGNEYKLSDYLVFKTINNGTNDPEYTTRDDVITEAGTTMRLNQSNLSQNSTMKAGADANYITLVVYMPEDVGNEANYKTGTPAPFVNLGITVLATQVDSEKDSFGNGYDANLDYSDEDRLVYSETSPISISGNVTKGDTGVSSSDVGIDVSSQDVVTINSGDTSVSIPTESLSDGINTLTLNVTKGDTSSNFTVPDGRGVVYYDVTPMLNGQELDNTNPAPIGEYYVAKLPVGSSLQNAIIFHNGAELSNQVQTDGTTEYFQYNADTGIATIYVKHFSPFAATFDAVAKIGSTYFGTLYEAVKSCEHNETIDLLRDLTLDKANVTYGEWAKCATGTLYGTLDGNNHKITLGEDIFFGAYLGTFYGNPTIKNVEIESNNGTIYVQAYNSNFENVKVSGSIEVGNNTGAFVIYGSPYYGSINFKNCEMAATMYGGGTAQNYNAAFVGYGLGSGVEYNFENCKMTGTLTCGVSALFIGNDSQLGGDWKVNVNNFTFGEDAVVRNTLTSGYNWKFNGIVAANNAYGTPVVTIDGTEYSGKDGFTNLVDAKNNIWEAKHFAYGPKDSRLAIKRNDDGKFTITPAASENVSKYVVSIAVYSSLKEGGSGLQTVKETIVVNENTANEIVTKLKDLKFVDQTWLDNNPNAEQGELAGNTIFTLDGVSYYMITDNDLCTLNGNPKAAQIYGVTAYDANGNIVASAPLTK